ncbi:MAG: MOSC domain-containing protein [Planctomycetota bacterium]|nr:MOSC domain-containing protein [Planctomycetota bacterium]
MSHAERLTGRITWIGIAPEPCADPIAVSEVEAIAELGLAGDHHARRRPGSSRQVTLIEAEHLGELERELGRAITPGLCRRNLVVEGLDLRSCFTSALRIGEALLEVSGECTPCSRMEENLGPGGFAAMAERGGLTARVLRGGLIRVGDAVRAEAGAHEH